MGRIRVLSDVVANKIAAGEVVERPASVVKELLENSVDAGSTRIRIDAESGGRRLIRIIDDGHGMLRDDALLAFERHATSKLSDVKDLLSIATLGFRGEALPSIASVSRLTLETRSADETTGTMVEIAGGKLLKCEEAALGVGTTITVRDLFFNVPARKKFLRSDQTELAHIASLATHYSLAYPDKAFELRHDNRELLNVSAVSNLQERVFQVFGAQTLDELVPIGDKRREAPVDADEEPRIFHLRGFVSRPQVQKLNRNSIYLFVNGRLIRDRLLLHALSAGYAQIIPPNAYPFALLFLDCPAEEVDVNVHPSKVEVRFRRGSFVHDFVRDSVREVLTATRPVSNLPPATPRQPGARLPYSEFSQQVENAEYALPPDEPQQFNVPPPGEQLPEFRLRPPHLFPTAQKFEFEPAVNEENRFGQSFPTGGQQMPTPGASPKRGKAPDTHGPLPEGIFTEPADSLDALRDLRPIGQLHDSFIVALGADGLWIIDQHVAHERILFEKVLRQIAAGQVEKQQLLVPLLIELTPPQQVEYNRIAADMESVGFEMEPFGPRTIAVKAAPADVTTAEIERVIFEILETAEQEMRQTTLEEIRRNMAASIACRAAIKINTPLDATRIGYLLNELAKTEFPMSCPHGRPIALRYATKDILKGFHRI
ncbi:MAG: DNA mismatch repair endonuclease MutL [Bryobacterales bacterium]|nr:DNA mismatch repair endonuclease MutL [Bryobacterales bacterium]